MLQVLGREGFQKHMHGYLQLQVQKKIVSHLNISNSCTAIKSSPLLHVSLSGAMQYSALIG